MARLLREILVFALLLYGGSSFAWCLGGRSCTTDDSVCDMGQNTTHILGSRTFVWAYAKRELEIYQRLATIEILRNCSNGQQLILHSDGSLRFDRPILSEIAKGFCRVADIVTTPIPGRQGDGPGFETKCVITKSEEARKAHLEREAQISTAKMIEEDNRTPSRSGAASNVSSQGTGQTPDDCRKSTLGMIFGLPGKCAGQQ